MPEMYRRALSEDAQKIFTHFSRFKKFYLVGGTALALQIGHRRSVDFDFFTGTKLQKNLFSQVKLAFPGLSVSVTYRAPDQLNLIVNGVKTTFFYFPYPLIEAFINFNGVRLVSIPDIAAMKAFSIGKRLSYKDYVDWYFLLKERHIELKEVIRLACKKFGDEFSDRLFLGQLVSMEDIHDQKIDFLRDAVDRKTIQKFLEKTVRAFKL